MKFPVSALLLANVAADDVLVTFDGAKGTTYTFTELNDPVMGGKSTGTWAVSKDGFGVFDGEVVDVPSLSAPGFIKAAANGTFKDVSADIDDDLVLMVRSTTPDYAGYRVTLAANALSPAYSCGGGSSLPFSGGCYKAKFSMSELGASEDFQEIRIPLNQFSDHWSPATGEHTKECADDASVCLTAKALKKIERVEIWAEGALGDVHLEIKSISFSKAQNLGQESLQQSKVRPSAPFDQCKDGVQDNLNYKISTRFCTQHTCETADMPIAEAVCCDSRNLPFAEPQFLFEAPDVNLFDSLDSSKVTTFYDSVCGIPLFQAPINRTFDEWKAESQEHGWPSFRTQEIMSENLVVDEETGYVTSTCGTHLGTYLPDDSGKPRYCIDLSCISGNKDSMLFLQ